MSETNARFQGGGVILPQGSSPGSVNSGEKALVIDTNGKVATVSPDGTPTVVSPPEGAWATVGPTVGDAADLTIATGLNGDTDGDYEIIANLAACAGNEEFTLQPNGVDTGCSSISVFGTATPTVAASSNASLYLTDGVNTLAPHIHIRLQSSSALPGGRLFEAHGCRGINTGGVAFSTIGNVSSAAGNITSLVLHGSSADAIKAGSVVKWRRLGVP